MSIVTLLTDYGTSDSYVGELKGVLVSLAPGAQVVDITHDIAPGDIAAAAFVIGRAWKAFPRASVHLVVVDPGVGTPRRALAAQAAGHFFTAPDNGLLSNLLGHPGARAVALETPVDASATFHGRDLFAPAAAALARGEPLESLGDIVTDPVKLPPPKLRREGRSLVGEVVHVDRFGTLVTTIPGGKLAPGVVRVGVYDVPLLRTFADVAPGEVVAIVGSAGTVEIAVRDGRACDVLGLGRGTEVSALLG